MIGTLPDELEIAGKKYEIRTDYRTILHLIEALNDPVLEDIDKKTVLLKLLFIYPEKLPENKGEEIMEQINWFLDAGIQQNEEKKTIKSMDWKQDENLIFPAVNHVAGCEVRNLAYLHWWTFLGYYMEIQKGVFASILGIRSKLNKGVKLEKAEREFVNENRSIIMLKKELTEEEEKELKFLEELTGCKFS